MITEVCPLVFWRFKSCEMLHSVIGWVVTDISEDCNAYIFIVKQFRFAGFVSKLPYVKPETLQCTSNQCHLSGICLIAGHRLETFMKRLFKQWPQWETSLKCLMLMHNLKNWVWVKEWRKQQEIPIQQKKVMMTKVICLVLKLLNLQWEPSSLLPNL